VLDGWLDLVCDLVERLDGAGVPYMVDEISVIGGRLRFRIEAPPSHPQYPELTRLIANAERESATICELCGKVGEPRGRHYLMTLCAECFKLFGGSLMDYDGRRPLRPMNDRDRIKRQ
jgi:hypothetical protein